jgi:hypothetical protein
MHGESWLLSIPGFNQNTQRTRTLSRKWSRMTMTLGWRRLRQDISCAFRKGCDFRLTNPMLQVRAIPQGVEQDVGQDTAIEDEEGEPDRPISLVLSHSVWQASASYRLGLDCREIHAVGRRVNVVIVAGVHIDLGGRGPVICGKTSEVGILSATYYFGHQRVYRVTGHGGMPT